MMVSEERVESVLTEQTASVVETLVRESLECERQRYESMLSTGGRMIASLSLVSVALATVMPFLFEEMPRLKSVLAMEFSIVFFLIVLSLAFAVAAQYRRSYQTLGYPSDIIANAEKNSGRINDPFESRKWLSKSLNDATLSLQKLSDWMGGCLRISNAILIIALVLIALFGVIDAVAFLATLQSCPFGVH